jgi:hypothetical protein
VELAISIHLAAWRPIARDVTVFDYRLAVTNSTRSTWSPTAETLKQYAWTGSLPSLDELPKKPDTE